MSSPAEMVKDILVTKSVGTFPAASSAWGINISRKTDVPDAQLVCYDSPASENPNPKWLLEYPHVQVLVRGAPDGYSAAYAKAKAVKDALLGIDPVDVTGVGRIDGITMIADIIPLQYDEKDRPQFTLNFRLIFEPATAAGSSRETL
jgi:hypothetical protein